MILCADAKPKNRSDLFVFCVVVLICLEFYRACENSRKRKLRELYAVTTDLGSEEWISLQQPLDASYAAAELYFLSENDIAK